MGTHPIFESDFDCLTEKGFKKKCLLINQFGLSSFLLRNKSKTDQFRNGFDSVLAIRSSTTPRDDIGDDPRLVSKYKHDTAGLVHIFGPVLSFHFLFLFFDCSTLTVNWHYRYFGK